MDSGTSKIAIFSDLHLSTHRFPEHEGIFVKTLQQLRIDCDELWLLGDIFDLLVGPFDFWKSIHKDFFKELNEWVQAGKKVLWIQGNHDFYLKDLLDREGIESSDDHIIKAYANQRLYLAHGDLVDTEDQKYLDWRAKTRSPLFRKILLLIPPFLQEQLILKIGHALSKKSRKKSGAYQSSENSKALKELYRKFSENQWNEGFRGVFLGHSHMDDLHISKDESSFYLNLGTWLDGAPRYAIWDSSEYNYPKVIKI